MRNINSNFHYILCINREITSQHHDKLHRKINLKINRIITNYRVVATFSNSKKKMQIFTETTDRTIHHPVYLFSGETSRPYGSFQRVTTLIGLLVVQVGR